VQRTLKKIKGPGLKSQSRANLTNKKIVVVRKSYKILWKHNTATVSLHESRGILP